MTVVATPFLLGGFAALGAGASMAFAFDGFGSLIAGIGLIAFSCVFIAVGAGMFAGPWILDGMKHKRERYALSDRAGYVATQWWKRRMNVIPLTADTPVEFNEGRGGTGSVWFRFETTVDAEGDVSTKRQGFEAIGDAEYVYGLIRDAVAALGEGKR